MSRKAQIISEAKEIVDAKKESVRSKYDIALSKLESAPETYFDNATMKDYDAKMFLFFNMPEDED